MVWNKNQFKLLKNAFIVLNEENLKGFEKADNELRQHSINIIKGFEHLKEFEQIKKEIILQAG